MFKDLGIKGRVLLLTLLPTSLLAMVLGGYFTWVQLSDMRAQLIERGQLIAEQLAPLAATALARKDTAVLNRIYEEEADIFFEDRSDQPLQDDVLARLLSFPNVVVTAHQAFLTREALAAIADTTLDNIAAWQDGTPRNRVRA